MKKNIILTLALSAIILTGCNKETELIDDFKTSETAAATQSAQNAETENKITETEGETQYILGGEAETSVSINESDP